MKNINLQLSIDETNLILEALGNLPFSKVYALIAKIQAQASQQLNGEGQGQNGAVSEQSAQMQD
jgi:hypothetical protein